MQSIYFYFRRIRGLILSLKKALIQFSHFRRWGNSFKEELWAGHCLFSVLCPAPSQGLDLLINWLPVRCSQWQALVHNLEQGRKRRNQGVSPPLALAALQLLKNIKSILSSRTMWKQAVHWLNLTREPYLAIPCSSLRGGGGIPQLLTSGLLLGPRLPSSLP